MRARPDRARSGRDAEPRAGRVRFFNFFLTFEEMLPGNSRLMSKDLPDFPTCFIRDLLIQSPLNCVFAKLALYVFAHILIKKNNTFFYGGNTILSSDSIMLMIDSS